jgi:hypothetical protein
LQKSAHNSDHVHDIQDKTLERDELRDDERRRTGKQQSQENLEQRSNSKKCETDQNGVFYRLNSTAHDPPRKQVGRNEVEKIRSRISSPQGQRPHINRTQSDDAGVNQHQSKWRGCQTTQKKSQ